MQRKHRIVAAGFAGLLATVASIGIADAKDGDVRVNGRCTGASTSKLKLAPRPSDNQTRVEFEVDQNVVGVTWNVVIKDNGVIVLRRTATTTAPSGSFEVAKRLPGATGHSVKAKATNPSTGETCTASASV
jgi:hypothetical protein